MLIGERQVVPRASLRLFGGVDPDGCFGRAARVRQIIRRHPDLELRVIHVLLRHQSAGGELFGAALLHDGLLVRHLRALWRIPHLSNRHLLRLALGQGQIGACLRRLSNQQFIVVLRPRDDAFALGHVLCCALDLQGQVRELALAIGPVDARDGLAGRHLVARRGHDLRDRQRDWRHDGADVGWPQQPDERVTGDPLGGGGRIDRASCQRRRRDHGSDE